MEILKLYFKNLIIITSLVLFAGCGSDVSVELIEVEEKLAPKVFLPKANSITPTSIFEDTEKIITLEYSHEGGEKATSCALSRLDNIDETSPCSCNGMGICTVGVKGLTAFNGSASFEYTVSVNNNISNIATVSFSINDPILNCPTGFVEADGNGSLGTTDFCVMKYEAKCLTGSPCSNFVDIPVSKASGFPWVSIRADETQGGGSGAQARCEAISESGFSGDFSLISNPEWMTIARDIESNPLNWSSGTVGTGHIPRGHSDNSPIGGLDVSDPNDYYDGTGNNSSELPGSGWEQKRVHILSSGSDVWDFAGNMHEWVDWDLNSAGFDLGPQDEMVNYKEFSISQTASLLNDQFQPSGAYTSANSIGQWSGGIGGAAFRGGDFDNTVNTGIYTITLQYTPSTALSTLGFRCVYRPQQAPIAKSLTPANANQNTESIYTLLYSDVNGDIATSCRATKLINLVETTPCSCDGAGICTIGVTGINNYIGAANFDYTVSDDDGVSNIANVNFNIDDLISCPTGFIAVDGNASLGTSDFCVMKYEAKQGPASNALSKAEGTPWGSVNADDAQTSCEAMSEGGFEAGTFSLISNPEWRTISGDIESVGINWSGGSVGSGDLARGWSARTAEDGFQNSAAAPTTDTSCVYNSAMNTCSATGTHKLKRTHKLSNGFEIWDLSGNVWEWVDWDSGDVGFTTGPTDGDTGGWNELNDLVGSLTNNDVGPLGAYTSTQQAGKLYPNNPINPNGAALRGAAWYFGDDAGIFTLNLYDPTTFSLPRIGFRCVYRP